ncbi:NAD(P)-dependent oxidoreductase [Sulfitobacter pseudonitzschiae]|uniref:NAD(P)-dependent oxidoreductase n=2 Tax=Pseudosulfitobacter pseudonitzschiae TaxID=1402135 RepID=A0A9Q2NHG4_9RHOB|nr:NAD(P)-dependent oxidoreductase [Pseudosulfitobacter pseudonitzschiae]MBM2297030.1 NAD(P)-dependent oxidoreductase [Pseudosulfitobacter pseudonitzschiae]MBM2301944.1 NAD(P)-dependent oxidoreductase [Pseudosulfitobacter pseudonitzschiae]MBM2311726.1 NAD(P)-dependent oxidoreductase [Pseudosulfitobacter pseudonitzschiae]MBM2316640.1 NAD(P)-dependent oxidoreductase [Pseudosulfitobacter pseudonitzschiae]
MRNALGPRTMSRILITGATGFVGLPVAQQLAAAGHDLTCVIRTGSEARLEGLEARTVTCDDLFGQSADWWAGQLAGIDTVVHLAWYAEPGKYLTSERNLDCLTGTLAMAKGAAAAGVRRFAGAGTCFEYDLSVGYLSVDTPLAPETPYAAAKVAAFTMLTAWCATAGIEFLWARLFYLYGDREDTRRLVPQLHDKLARGVPVDLTRGTALRDYLDVRDAARMLAKDITSTRTGPTNICSGQGVTIRALAEGIADQYGRRDLLNFGAYPENLTDPPVIVGVRAGEVPPEGAV